MELPLLIVHISMLQVSDYWGNDRVNDPDWLVGYHVLAPSHISEERCLMGPGPIRMFRMIGPVKIVAHTTAGNYRGEFYALSVLNINYIDPRVLS